MRNRPIRSIVSLCRCVFSSKLTSRYAFRCFSSICLTAENQSSWLFAAASSSVSLHELLLNASYAAALVALRDSDEVLVDLLLRQDLEGPGVARFHHPHLDV